jgi:hypothetical protein
MPIATVTPSRGAELLLAADLERAHSRLMSPIDFDGVRVAVPA